MKTTTLPSKDSMNRLPLRLPFLHIPLVLALAWFAVSDAGRADNCEQGCDFLFRNTFLGQEAAVNNIGLDNAAIGFYSLNSNTTGANNTAVGSSTLTTNTTGGYNTDIGAGALHSNTTGSRNVATGASALYSNQPASTTRLPV